MRDKDREIVSQRPPRPGLLLAASLLLSAFFAAAAAADTDPGRIEFDDPTLEISESAGLLVVIVERESGEDGAVSVDFASADGSAHAGSDYNAVEGSLSWLDQEDDDRIFVVEILDDTDAEEAETFVLTLSNVTGGAELEVDKSIAQVVIRDNDGNEDEGEDDGPSPGVLKFDERSFEVFEGVTVAVITVERSQGEDGEVSVDFATEDQSATSPDDYEQTSGTLTWDDGDGSARTFEIAIVDDDLDEEDETVRLVLGNPTGGAVLDAVRFESVLKIEDDDGAEDDGEDDGEDGDRPGTLKFDQRTFEASEGAGIAVITVERSRGESGEVSVMVTTGGGTASEGDDYLGVAEILSWSSGDGSTKSLVVPIVDDGEGESSETVGLLLSDATGGADIDPIRGTSVLTILDDDGGAGGDDPPNRSGVLKFDEESFEVVEGQAMAVVRVERSMGESGPVSVDYATSDGSAEEGLDYQSASGTLSWGAGDGSDRTFMVPILEDDLDEGTESILLELTNPTGGATLDPERGQARLDILDDDGSTASCVAGPTTLCLQQGRFQAEITWRAFDGRAGKAGVIPVSDTSGLFWFLDEQNIELLLKTVDACDLQGFESYWIFFAATTNLDFTLEVTDTVTGLSREYTNRLGRAALPVQDVETFKSCH